jgi:hypothetical protein
MNKTLGRIVPSILLFTFALIQAQVVRSDHHEMAETSRVLQVYSCNYAKGKGAKDLASAVSFWQTQMDKIDSKDMQNYFGATLTPISANTDADFYWLGGSPNLNSFARGGEAYSSSVAGQAADARFDKMSSCKSNLFFSEQIHAGMEPEEGNSDFVMEAFGCTLKKGKTRANVSAAEGSYKAMYDALGLKVNVFRLAPFIANTAVDLYYFIAHDDMVAFGSNNTHMITSKMGPAANGALNQVMECKGGLYAGNIVHVPAGQ